MNDFKPIDAKISLHGLGFIVVQLGGNQRLHVWHPDLPRRERLEETKVHSHRFAFESRILVGTMENVMWCRVYEGELAPDAKVFDVYSHDGPRRGNGERGWKKLDGQLTLDQSHTQFLEPGLCYRVPAYAFHHTEPTGDGKVATLMHKTWEGDGPSASLATAGVEPQTAFDRFQLQPHELWGYVTDVLGR